MPRYVPEYLKTRMNAGAMTLAELIWIKPTVGAVIAFTDFEEDLEVDDVIYSATPGMQMKKTQSTITLSVDNSEGQGVIAGLLTASAIFSGKYEGAEFERAICDYAVIKGYEPGVPLDPVQNRAILMAGTLGRFTVTDLGFSVELRSKAQRLQQQVGDVISPQCRVRKLFDEQCKAPFNGTGTPNPDPDTGLIPDGIPSGGPWGYHVSGSVQSVPPGSELTFRSSVVDPYPLGWFRHGLLTWTTGDNIGMTVDVREDFMSGGVRMLALVSPEGLPPTVGWGFDLEAGCDRTHSACVRKFHNAKHFQGDPWIIGDTEFYKLP
jgi:hypothetical protein